MGRWLEALKKHENADDGHPQNPQKGEVVTGCDGPGTGVSEGNAKAAAAEAGFSRNEIHEVHQPRDAEKAAPSLGARATYTAHPNPVRAIMERLEGDMERYAEALRAYGPMSYGQAMQVLGWGGTRAGQAESDLRAAGRIAFNQLGRAYLVDEEASHDG